MKRRQSMCKDASNACLHFSECTQMFLILYTLNNFEAEKDTGLHLKKMFRGCRVHSQSSTSVMFVLLQPSFLANNGESVSSLANCCFENSQTLLSHSTYFHKACKPNSYASFPFVQNISSWPNQPKLSKLCFCKM